MLLSISGYFVAFSKVPLKFNPAPTNVVDVTKIAPGLGFFLIFEKDQPISPPAFKKQFAIFHICLHMGQVEKKELVLFTLLQYLVGDRRSKSVCC